MTEAAITRILSRLARERTVIVIAHRLATVRQAHRIVVLHDGAIAETGTHEELLLRRDGVYARMMARRHSVGAVA